LTRLDEHYRGLRESVAKTRQLLPNDTEPDLPAVRKAVAQLADTERLVQL